MADRLPQTSVALASGAPPGSHAEDAEPSPLDAEERQRDSPESQSPPRMKFDHKVMGARH